MKFVLLSILLFIYPIVTFAQTLYDSNLPIVVINTDLVNGVPQTIPDEPKVGATMKILYHPDGTRNYMSDINKPEFLNYNGRIGIEIRGSSSQTLPKKPYGLTTRMADNVTVNNVNILGMPKENDWILNSLAFDPTLIRNYLSYDLMRSMGNYAPRGVYCEVVINGTYMGLYIFMEKIKIDDDRVNITQLSTADNASPDVTGGYIVKADKTTGGDVIAWSMASYGATANYLYDEPKQNVITSAQKTYIKNIFTALQNAATAQNSSIVNGYPSIIDIPSFVDYMIMSEFTSNADSYQFSTYFHKERNGKLRAGPVWDYDLTFGNDIFAWGLDRSKTYHWQFENYYKGYIDNTGSKFWKDLFYMADFSCQLKKRWKELTATNGPLNFNVVAAKIDQINTQIAEGAIREEFRWNLSGRSTEIMNMKTWIQNRISWMNSMLANVSICSNPVIPPLVISKINYHPPASKGFQSDDLEFIEIANAGNSMVNLTGIYFSNLGFTYQFPANATIAAGQKLILAANTAIYQQFYGKAAFGKFTRNLSNNSEKLVLADAFGNVIDSVRYQDEAPWPVEADSGGYYLELKSLNLDNNQAANWQAASLTITGTDNIAVFEPEIKIFPNPAKNRVINISIPSGLTIDDFSISIYDLDGRRIFQSLQDEATGEVQIELNDIKPGIYIAEFCNKEFKKTDKLIIQ